MRLKVATPWLHGDMSGERGAGWSSRASAWSRGLAAAAAFVAVSLIAACTTDTPTGNASSPITTSATTAATTPPTSTGPPSTESTVPPSATGSATYFTPTDPSSFAMTGRIAVEQALQDPFSNLLQRGALHDQPVTLDVVGTPDDPVTPAAGVTILFGTCRCADRGSGLRLTVEDAAAVRVEANGDVGIRGRFRPVVTASDAITLKPA